MMKVESFYALSAHKRCVKSIASSPTEHLFVSTSSSNSSHVVDDRSVKFWDDRQKDGRYDCFRIFEDKRSRYISSLAYSPDGTTVAFSSVLEFEEEDVPNLTWVESRIRICNVKDQQFFQIAVVKDINFVFSVCFLHNRDYIAYGCDDGTVNILRKHTVQDRRMQEKTSFERIQTLRRQRQGILALVFCNEYSFLVATSHDSTAFVWRLQDDKTFKPLKSLEKHTKSVSGVAFSSSKKNFATISHDGQFCVWSSDTLHCVYSLQLPLVLHCVAAFPLPFEDSFAFGARDGTLLFWTNGVDAIRKISLTKRSIECISFLHNDVLKTILAFGARDGIIRVCRITKANNDSEEDK